MDLSDQDRAILDFERISWQLSGPKSVAIQDELSMSPSTYYRRLQALIASPYAEAADPLLVRRLRRAQADRRRTRFTGPHWKRSQP